MRAGLRCLLLELRQNALVLVQERLVHHRVDCLRCTPAQLAMADPGWDPHAVLLEIDGPPTELDLLQAHPWGRRPRLAVCRRDPAAEVARALALGCADVLVGGFDEAELLFRLDRLRLLRRLEQELERRRHLFAHYLDAPVTAGAAAAPHRPKVAIVGPAGAAQVQVVNALPQATVAYVDDTAMLAAVATALAPDLFVVTGAASLAATLDIAGEGVQAEHRMPTPILGLGRIGDGFPAPSLMADQVDPSAPLPTLRMRIHLALQLRRRERDLRAPCDLITGRLLLDGLSGLFNRGLLMDYLTTADPATELGLVVLQLKDLAALNAVRGHAAGNRLIALTGERLARSTRADDFPAHLGSGRFAVAGQFTGEAGLQRLEARLATILARPCQGEPVAVATSSLRLDRGMDAGEALAYALRRLGRDTRRAA